MQRPRRVGQQCLPQGALSKLSPRACAHSCLEPRADSLGLLSSPGGGVGRGCSRLQGAVTQLREPCWHSEAVLRAQPPALSEAPAQPVPGSEAVLCV